MVEKIPPHNIDAEEGLLGSILLGGKNVMRWIDNQVESADFFSDRNRFVFEACVNLYNRVEAINQISVAQELSRQDKLEACGGAALLGYLIANCPTHLDAPDYARIVSALSKHRQIIAISEQVGDLGYKQDLDTDSVIGKIDELWDGFKKSNTNLSKLTTSYAAANDIFDMLEKYSEPSHVPRWGFKDMDDITGGIYPEYVLIGARPSVGKTQLVLDIIQNLNDQRVKVLLASAEMLANQIYERKVSREIRRSVLHLRKFGMTDEEKDRTIKLVASVADENISYLSGDLYFNDIYREALALKDNDQLGAIFIDYIGALRDCYVENKDSQNTRISRISNKIQAMTHELKVPVIVTSQLNREVEHRSDGFGKGKTRSRKPQLADLRDSGSLEQDADVVFLLHRDIKDNDELSPVLKVKMAKNRQLGSAKSISLLYNYNLRKYVDYTDREGDDD